jgi:hypothetical protein
VNREGKPVKNFLPNMARCSCKRNEREQRAMQSTRRTNHWQNTTGMALPLLLAGFLLASAGPIQGQTLAASVAQLAPYAEAKENADRQAKEWIARGTPGLALAVAVDGKIVYSEGFGFADLEERAPVWPTTKFRIGSISKRSQLSDSWSWCSPERWIWTHPSRNTFRLSQKKAR